MTVTRAVRSRPVGGAGPRPLRPARGYVDADWQAKVLDGWLLLPDNPLTSVEVWVNGRPAARAPLEFRRDVARAYPRIPHAGRSGFRVRVPDGRLARDAVNRVRLLGCRDGRPVARAETMLFHSDLVPRIAAPPPRLVRRVQCEPDVALYRGLGFRYYLQLGERLARHRGSRAVRRLLDWGCGFGRVAAHFLAQPGGPAVWGCDVDGEAIEWCAARLPRGHFTRIGPTPPLPYADRTFDAAIALAVFPGLDPDACARWLAELRRVLVPGGLLLASVQGPFTASFEFPSDPLVELRRRGVFDGGRNDPANHTPSKGAWRGYFVTRDYVAREWGRHLELLEHLEGEVNSDHDLVVMRRRRGTRRPPARP